MPQTSVVVPTYNSIRTIESCLKSLENQTTECEIIVIDRCSKDGTLDVANSHKTTVIVSDAHRSEARNLGIAKSRSEVVISLDSDMSVPPAMVEECEAKIGAYDALVIPEVSIGRGFWAECRALERRSNIGNGLVEAARCFRRTALMSIGCYNSHLEAGEDWDLQNRAKRNRLRIGRTFSPIIHDEGKLALGEIVRKKYAYGKTIRSYLALNPAVGVRQISPISRILVPGIRLASKDPIRGSGIIFMKTAEFLAVGLGHLGGTIANGEP